MEYEKLGSAKITISLFIIAFIIFSFMMSGVLTHNHFLKMIDMSSLEWFTHYFGNPQRIYEDGLFNCYMTFCATIGDVGAMLKLTLILVVLLFIFKNKSQAVWVLLVMTTGTWINYLIKQTVGRQRPLSHLNIDSGLSFPSGHSNASTLFIIIIVIVVIPMLKGKIAQILVATISTMLWISILFCRMYFHAHYFSDVIGGVSLAVLWVSLFVMAYPLFTLWRNDKN